MTSRWRTYWVINGTLLAALLLTLFPLPNWMRILCPDLISLVLIYWAMTLPVATGLSTGFIFGLIVDIAMGSLLGQHALGLSVVSYITIKGHQRVRIFPPLQQGMIIMFVLFMQQLIFIWIHGITQRAPESLFIYFVPCITSMLFWPLLYNIMRDIRHRFLPGQHLHF
jgi:rod shape-determining protein MreD